MHMSSVSIAPLSGKMMIARLYIHIPWPGELTSWPALQPPLGFRGAPLGFRGFPLGFHAALLSIFRKKFYNPRPIAAKSAGYSSLPRVPRVFCGGSDKFLDIRGQEPLPKGL